MSKIMRGIKITRNTGKGWGWICIIPFGWIFFMASLIRRKNDVIKYKSLDTGIALDVLHNYMRSFVSFCIFVAVLCLVSFTWTKGYYILPGIGYIISVIIIPITYNIVTNKILDFEEKKQSRRRMTTIHTVKNSNAQSKSVEDYYDDML